MAEPAVLPVSGRMPDRGLGLDGIKIARGFRGTLRFGGMAVDRRGRMSGLGVGGRSGRDGPRGRRELEQVFEVVSVVEFFPLPLGLDFGRVELGVALMRVWESQPAILYSCWTIASVVRRQSCEGGEGRKQDGG